jgi:hypothetical protein
MNRAPKTREQYVEPATQFASFTMERGMPARVDDVTREHVEASTRASCL